MRQPGLRHPVAVAAIVGSLLLGACSGGSGAPSAAPSSSGSTTTTASGTSTPDSPEPEAPSAKEVWAKVRAKALAATSGTMTGSVDQAGSTMKVSITGATDGDPQHAVLDLGKTQGKATVLTVNGTYYMTGDDAFWTEQGGKDAATALKGKYVVIEEGAAKEMGDFRIGGILREMFSDPEMSSFESLVTPVEAGTVGDTKAWVLGKEGQGQIFVSADGAYDLLKIVGPKTSPGEFTFSGWNVPPKLTAPAKKNIVTP